MYAEVEPLYGRSQAIREKALGPEHPDPATSFNNRALLLTAQVRAQGLSSAFGVVQGDVFGRPLSERNFAIFGNKGGVVEKCSTADLVST